MIEHLSYSSINTFLLCPRSWRFRYIEKPEVATSPNLVFGSAFHDTIETFLLREDTSVPLAAIWFECWGKQLEDDRNKNISWGDKSEDEFTAMGERMFSHAKTIETVEAIDPLILDDKPTIEKFIKLHVPGVPIPVIGYIDIITSDGVPGDFKTSAQKWYKSIAADEAQPIFYLAALNQLGYDLNPDMKFRHYIFVKTKTPQIQVIETQRTIDEMFALFDTVTEVWRSIEANVFPCNYNTWKCSEKWCEYWSNCRGALR